MKRTRRTRLKRLLARLLPQPSPIFEIHIEDVMSDLDPGMRAWR